jgi:hypothetical protein
MEETFQTIAQASVSWWDFKNSPSRHAVEASDFWLDRVHNTISVEPVTVEPHIRDAWLDKKTNNLGHSLVGRFVWLSVDSISFEVNLSKPVQDTILKRFGLEGAYQYLPSMLSDVTELSQASTQPLADRQTFAFCYGPKIAAIWSYKANKQSNSPALTQAVLFTRAVRGGNPTIKSDPLELQKKYQALVRKLRWNHSVLCTPLYPAYALSLVLHYDIGVKHKEVETKIRKMEANTGFHGFRDRHADLSSSKQAAIEAHELVDETSDYAGRIASTARKSKMLVLLLEFLRGAVDKVQGNNANTGATSRSDGLNFIRRHVEVMERRLDMLDTELAYIEKRIQIQKDMVSMKQDGFIEGISLMLKPALQRHISV